MRFVLMGAGLLMPVIVASVSLAQTLELGKECPPQGFYRDDQGKCRYAIPYRSGIGSHNGHWLPLASEDQALDPRQIDLGRFLFFDPVLSRDRDLSCAHCHDPRAGLSDGQRRAVGAGGQGVGRNRSGDNRLSHNTPGLWNTGFQERWFWDGRATSLVEQASGPLFSSVEMNATPALIEERLNALPLYQRFFQRAFVTRWRGKITVAMVLEALSVFESSLVSFNSRYDHYVLGDASALTEQERAGFGLFRSFLTRCSECHTPPLFTNQQRLFIGVPEPEGMDPNLTVKVPSLRNLSRSAPYMHAGQFATLEEVVEFYNDGGGRSLGVEPRGRIHWHVRPIGLSISEQQALVAFLRSLDDSSAKIEIPEHLPSGLRPMQ